MSRRTKRRPTAHAVRKMRAAGLSEDRISFELGVNKNTLRAHHARALDEGREAARAEATDNLPKRSIEILEICSAGFDGPPWMTEDQGNLLHDGAWTVREAFVNWLKMYNRTIDNLADNPDLAAVAAVLADNPDLATVKAILEEQKNV